ncbi:MULTISPECIES: TetR/AcrR family transcriptional regulator [Thiorhodovibrio]|uniref:TetR/AcrR family transcriptional regulator n=1 Tax=Thiorhodovibrio TaxID=61593 RepID=UPI001911D511|nr:MULTISPECIES: TetR/AcrR family transcriptional regulator [Thiorhodovibrio]MBK5968386.1 hypothetical protein [Thiorhodovibrio winogradskyi]WPL13161.1 DNA-binding transcriptional regulator EnvR [Thiorhodovibrio litoralis]
MPTIERKQRQFNRRERDILAAALELCSTPAWEAVSVSQIAERAEVGKGTVYMHFASKDELLFRLMVDFYRGLLELLRAQIPQGSPTDQIRLSMERALRYHIEHKAYRYVVEYCERCDFKERADPRWREDLLLLDQAFQDWVEPILTAGIEQGLIAPRSPARLMLGIGAAFRGAVSMIWAGADWCLLGDEESVAEAVSEFVVCALVGQASAAPAGQRNEQGQQNNQGKRIDQGDAVEQGSNGSSQC